MFTCSKSAFKALLLSALLVSFTCVVAIADPVVTNVTAAQRPDSSRLIDIHYDLASAVPCTVWFVVSSNGGTSWNIPAMTHSGAVGPAVNSGSNKAIVWDAGADIPAKIGSFKVRVYADDGTGANLVVVPGGTFPYQNNVSQQVHVGAFLIDKYEVTNQRYCEYLNNANQSGQDPPQNHWDTHMEISRSGTAPNFVFNVYPGKANFPVRWVTALDAEAFAVWLSARDNRSYRLPTEQEWEKAAAWNNVQSVYSQYGFQGESIDCTRANFNNNVVIPYGPCVGVTSEVGRYSGTSGTLDSKSFFGCYDMSGNVSEWTSSEQTPGSPYRMLRGGGWSYPATSCQSSSRDYFTQPGNRYDNVGFRLVMDPI